MWAGNKGRENAGGMEEIMTVIRERSLEFAIGNSWNILSEQWGEIDKPVLIYFTVDISLLQ